MSTKPPNLDIVKVEDVFGKPTISVNCDEDLTIIIRTNDEMWCVIDVKEIVAQGPTEIPSCDVKVSSVPFGEQDSMTMTMNIKFPI